MSTRPLLLGYLRAHLLMTEAELASTTQELASFAAAEGYTLGTVFVEHTDREPAAFEALVAAVRQQEAAAVVVPNSRHVPADLTEHLAGIHLLTAHSHP
jgi:hypothetical protein